MLPKTARLLLLSAILAASNAKAAPTRASGPGTCQGGRITNLGEAAAFAGCRAVTGNLIIERSELSDLSALSELRSVSGELAIRDNPMLRDLDGLERLERAGSLTLHANGLYRTVGLEGLRQVGTLSITKNPLLISLRGFNHLRRVDTLVVSNNPRICAQLGWFPALVRVERSLTVHSNFGLSRHDVARLFTRTRGAS